MPFLRFPVSERALDTKLRDVLNWRITATLDNHPDPAPCVYQRPAHVYTDASGNGHVGCVIAGQLSGRRITARTHLAAWATSRGMRIFESEQRALISGLVVASVEFQGRPLWASTIIRPETPLLPASRTVRGRAGPCASCSGSLLRLLAPRHGWDMLTRPLTLLGRHLGCARPPPIITPK